jgi:hypothetical protein
VGAAVNVAGGALVAWLAAVTVTVAVAVTVLVTVAVAVTVCVTVARRVGTRQAALVRCPPAAPDTAGLVVHDARLVAA